jgi:diaminopimelate epimerase
MKFFKYHALGNDYIVLDPEEVGDDLSESIIRQICHRNYGVGSDGILLGPLNKAKKPFYLRIFNPDGTEAEKSGNGLRIFSRYLYERGLVKEGETFIIRTKGGDVTSRLFDGGKIVVVKMGRVSFDSNLIPVKGPQREVINEIINCEGREFKFCAVTIGNPHCVILCDEISEEEVKRYGPVIEKNPLFPNRINVQFMKVIDRNNIQIEIWERGAGYTLASGSSSSACAAVAYRLGLCDQKVTVHMPGGEIAIAISRDYEISMTGPVTKVAEGVISHEIMEGREIK